MGRPKFPFKNKLQVNPLDRQFPGIIGDILSRLRDLENTLIEASGAEWADLAE